MQFFFFVDISEDMSKTYVQYFHNPIESLFYLVICHITEDEYVEMSFQVVFQKILTYNITLLVSYNISSILFLSLLQTLSYQSGQNVQSLHSLSCSFVL